MEKYSIDKTLVAYCSKIKLSKKKNGCWFWTGATIKDGYGVFQYKRKPVKAHRFSYELFKSKIPIGLTIDHLCRVRNCVNPEHLEAVSIRINTLRGNTVSAINYRKTHCSRGHEFTSENTYPNRINGRACKKCCYISRDINRMNHGKLSSKNQYRLEQWLKASKPWEEK